MLDAPPTALFIGFTGTPIDLINKNTRAARAKFPNDTGYPRYDELRGKSRMKTQPLG